MFSTESIIMGCQSQIKVWSSDEEAAFAAMRAAWEGVNELEMVLSDWNPQAEVAQLNTQGKLKISTNLLHAAQTARTLTRSTGGRFDFEKGGLFFAWREHRRRGQLLDPVEAQRLALLPPARINQDGVAELAPGNRWDFGGIGKGMAADLAGEILRSRGITHFQVDCSGDLLVGKALEPNSDWFIATEIEGLTIRVPSNHAVACSGDANQFVLKDGVRYSHIIDPRSGQAIPNQSLTFVVAPTATSADAWATACSVDPKKIPPRGITFIPAAPRFVP
jgi:thiamine biosynthesis lipoprotein